MMIDCIESAELTLKAINKELKCTTDEETIQKLQNQKRKLEDNVQQYYELLSKMPEIENRLVYKIVYLGKAPMQAIKEVADENYLNDIKPNSIRQIQRIYYKKVKNVITDVLMS